ncbi:MAG TPA: zf-HC2 domain-containing protein [Mycobacteriales bacterium]|nr:zf-HC2 domain-containing protein [Mycobacteriales bacterium]
MTGCEHTIALGAYVLGTLEEAERGQLDTHLRECAECRAELAELVTLPPLLERLSLQDLGEAIPVAAVPESLFDRVAAQARAEEERDRAETGEAVVVPFPRRRRVRLVAAAAAVVLLGGAATTVALVNSSGSSGAEVRIGAQGPVHMRVTLSSQTAGTALRVSVSGLPKDEHCRLVAVAADGSRDLVGRWWATYAGEAQVTGSTTIAAADIARLVLYGTDGERLVTVPV